MRGRIVGMLGSGLESTQRKSLDITYVTPLERLLQDMHQEGF